MPRPQTNSLQEKHEEGSTGEKTEDQQSAVHRDSPSTTRGKRRVKTGVLTERVAKATLSSRGGFVICGELLERRGHRMAGVHEVLE